MRIFKNLIIGSVLVATGCHAIDSTTVPTEDIVAQIEVQSFGLSQTEVRATLTLEHDALAYISLGPRDQLFASAAGRSVPMSEGLLTYRTQVPTSLGDIRYRVALARSLDSGAPDSSVLMPLDFRLYPAEAVSEDDEPGLAIEWDQLSDEAMFVHIDGPCIEAYDTLIPEYADDGAFVITNEHLQAHPWWDGGLCDAQITLERVRAGFIDPGFASGHIIARQTRTLSFQVYQ